MGLVWSGPRRQCIALILTVLINNIIAMTKISQGMGCIILGIVVAVVMIVAHSWAAHIGDHLCAYDDVSLCSERGDCVWFIAAAMATAFLAFVGVSLVIIGVGRRRSIDGKLPWWSLVVAIDSTITGVSLVLIRYMRVSCLGFDGPTHIGPAVLFYGGAISVLVGRVALLSACILRIIGQGMQWRRRLVQMPALYILWNAGMALWLISAVW